MPDLTRFDFHAKKFYFSEDVQRMSADEVGQYLLLMVAAWMHGKETTLPDDLPFLARLARVSVVSDAVLAKFPVVDTEGGPRRRNETLWEEWQTATARSEEGRANVAKRRDRQSGTPDNDGGVLIGLGKVPTRDLLTQPNPTQTNPNHTIPTQTSNTPSARASDSSATKSEWRNMAVKHKRFFGSQASTRHKEKYAEFCTHFTEDIVLECFDDWSQDAKEWVQNAGIKQPLFAFWKKLPDMAATVQAVRAAEKEETVAAEKAQVVEQQQAADMETSQRRQAGENWKRLTTAPEPTIGEADVLSLLPEVASA